jgi:HK97 family phage prohead protease
MMTDRVSLPPEVRGRLDERSSVGVLVQSRGMLSEARRGSFEVRENDDGTVHVTGYATTWDTFYDVAGGPPWGWRETIARGAASKSLAERDDVRFLINHDGLPLARTKSRTMTLEADDIGLLVDVPSLDVRGSTDAANLVSALRRGDVDQMSFAFYAHRQEWNDEYTERRITELELVDVSAVTYPANEATIIAARSAGDESGEPAGYPLALARARVLALG